MKKKNKNLFFKIIGGSSILSIAFAMVILICVLMIFDFFGTKITKEKRYKRKDNFQNTKEK